MSATGAETEITLTLTPDQAAALLPVEASEIRVEFLRPSNHSWRITADGSTYFLKVHTKDWYGGVPAPTVTRHEASTYRLLAEHGLATPTLVYDQLSTDNPLGWPYLILSELEGTSLTDLLDDADQDKADEAMHEVGAYLAKMHAITFEYPGYLVDGAPKEPPRPDKWQHGIWRYQRMLGQAIQIWTEDAAVIGPAVMDEVMTLLADKIDDLRRGFHPPRFTHGDCHASQFFLTETAGGLRVSGVVDLEVASAGSPMADHCKFMIEMAGRFRTRFRWWAPLIGAYGPIDFDLLRLWLLACGHINFTCHGANSWPGSRDQIVRHIVAARNWEQLFDLDAIVQRCGQSAAETSVPHHL